ncbi:hypothetical protein QEG98_22905 [Myxococcus sp. MxC21-1]|uniref:hypothetical protein n=1 Tax=Myxococcus sp. MxC21-1 TaxID=3041439 RepID=UPI00292E36DF|nr:hypothetical protein [Myxococcus sp. MxC21-1]WNZ58975.1 hypothetical protein QEG98_22905 [Myxococcus sp. MxC21-1]
MTGPAMHHAFDWQSFVKQHWEKAPARLALPGPILPVDQVFQAAISACAPFRHGTRFRALPDARFFVEAARLAAPGTLLPGEDDASLESFSRRASKHLDGASFQLHIEQPFMFDFALWSTLRDFLRGLLERVGVPVLPMATDLLLGRFSRGPYGIAKRPHHSLVTLVLQGRLRVRLWKKLWGSPPNETEDFDRHLDKATTLDAGPGELLYSPSRYWQLEEAQGDCMAVRVWIPVKGSRPTDAVKDVLVGLLEARHAHDERVPYHPYPWRRPRKGAQATIPSVEQTADTLHALTREEDVQQVLRLIWARRVSACALEPVPPPDQAPPLSDPDRVRKTPTVDIIRMKDPSGLWIWAVNGHAFPGPNEAVGQRLINALSSEAPPCVGELCKLARPGPQREAIRATLAALLRLRGIHVITGAEA